MGRQEDKLAAFLAWLDARIAYHVRRVGDERFASTAERSRIAVEILNEVRTELTKRIQA